MSLLQTVTDRLLKENSNDLSEWAVVFPNKRAGLFFKRLLSAQINNPVWSPAVLSLPELIERISPYESIDKFSLIYKLYTIMGKYYQEKESFERFFFWGETLIADFDEADKFMVDARLLFRDLSNVKDLEDNLSHLSEEQKKLLRRYWKSFSENLTEEQEKTLSIWRILGPVYEEFNAELTKEGRAYPGMMYKWVAGRLGPSLKIPYPKIIFAGFNALSTSEEKFLTWCCQHHQSEVYWDADDYYLNDEFQEAGEFLRDLKKRNPILADTFQESYANRAFEGRAIEVIECSTNSGQAQEAGRRLLEIMEKGSDPEKTAIILPDEKLLLPVLGAIPGQVEALNITMGYPLQNSLAYSFLTALIDLQNNTRNQNGLAFYYKNALVVLSHPFVFANGKERAGQVIEKIKKENILFPSAELLASGDEYLAALFVKVPDARSLIGYLQQNLLEAAQLLDAQSFESEFIFHFYRLLNNLASFLENTSFPLDFKTFSRLLNHSIYRERLPFEGEPLKGLQIMGFMETRNLDFENVILLSANEGVLPPAKQDISFIPYSVRKAYNLPTVDHSDAIFAYLFYRLMHNAKNITILYNSDSEKGKTGELSRFVKQLELESKIAVNYRTQEVNVFPVRESNIDIQKSPEIMAMLHRYTDKNGTMEKRLSPSAFSAYLDCSLRFYFKYVLDLYEEEEMEEDIRERELGNIFHRAIEIIYRDFDEEGKRRVKPEDIQKIKANIDPYIDRAFEEHFSVGDSEVGKKHKVDFSGQTGLAREIVKSLALQVLEIDAKQAPFEILGVEANDKKGFKLDYEITHAGERFQVGLKGVIDRIDKKDGVVRIIDYKTGKDKREFANISSLFDRKRNDRNKAVFQTFLYGLIFLDAHPQETGVVQAGLFNLREIYKENFDVKIVFGRLPVEDIRSFLEEYKNKLSELIGEIFDPHIDFVQTDDHRKCGYCPFNGICRREENV